jgi:hypothetical protein
LGIRNRQGCCCGTPPCANACSACGGVTLKNGVVKDANGEWPLKQPSTPGAAWRTAAIPFQTDSWTNGDCVQASGLAFYYYYFACGAEKTPQDGTVTLSIGYSAVPCSGTAFYTGSKTPGLVFDKQLTPSQFTCNPLKAAATFDSYMGLAPPAPEATVTLEIDDDTGKCQCRLCENDSYGSGDMILTYHIKEGDADPIDGTLTLKKTILPFSPVLPYAWTGNVDWWTGPSCSNPTADPSGVNVFAQCSNLQFLKWCGGVDDGYRTAPGIQKPDDVNFTLYGPDGDKQGWARLKDAPLDAPWGACCDPCNLPRADLTATATSHSVQTAPPGPTTDETIYSFDLIYSETPYEVPVDMFDPTTMVPVGHWRSEATAVDPGHGIPNPAVAYVVCSNDGVELLLTGVSEAFPYGTSDSLSPWTPPEALVATTDSTCDPLHIHERYYGCAALPSPPRVICVTVDTYLDESES